MKSSSVSQKTTHDGQIVVSISKLIRSSRFREQLKNADQLVEKKPTNREPRTEK